MTLEDEMERLKAKSEVISNHLWYANPDWIKISLDHAYAAGEAEVATKIQEAIKEEEEQKESFRGQFHEGWLAGMHLANVIALKAARKP